MVTTHCLLFLEQIDYFHSTCILIFATFMKKAYRSVVFDHPIFMSTKFKRVSTSESLFAVTLTLERAYNTNTFYKREIELYPISLLNRTS